MLASKLCSEHAANVSLCLDNHHVYRDATGFDLDIMLTRISFASNTNERYALRVYESHTHPHTYALTVRYTRSHTLPVTRTLVPISSSFADVFGTFCAFFRAKTRLHWENRFEKNLRDTVTKEYVDGYGGEEQAVRMGILSVAKGDTRLWPFEYYPPMEGPQGVLVEGLSVDMKEKYMKFDI
ncbi:hypothetical protein EJ05DRAFT_334649 [Pseudovirgaria hyperparasitica]|uniref:WGR domain-containing protein n=1 Tax=Pseudovirgaria hyperparasitica TaxID=470096 RepID=A0A6A6WAE9_9PEZI|nr:uncharacterized protein EJ05DRAFT_334649 [Pseudovirgaria hyperparasitica]KAF2759149.1 hypothetical protein EJ05DRAFT_334649 [Pseudovirgaria hyperparasitica]